MAGLLSVIFLGGIAWFAFLAPKTLLYYGSFTSLAGYLLILLWFTPFGRTPLGDPSERLSFFRWGWLLLKGQLALLIFTFVVFLGFFGGGPSFVKPVNFVAGIEEIQRYMTWQWGIFPWGVYGLWGCIVAYMVYVKKAPPYLYSVASKIWPKRFEPTIKTLIEATQFSASTLVIAVIATSITLLFSYAFEKYYNISHFTLLPITMSFFSLLVIFFSLKSTKFKIRHRAHWLTMGHLVSGMIVLLVITLVLAAFANQWFIEKNSAIVAQSACKRCGDFFSSRPQVSRFASLYWGWWLIWTPLAGSYLAAISKGRTVREFVVGLYFIPFLIWLTVKYLLPHSATVDLTYPMPIVYFMLIASPFMAWWILWKMLKNVEKSDFFQSGFIEPSPTLARSRLWLDEGTKTVGIARYSPKVTMLIFGTLFFQTTAGWYGLQIQLLTCGILVINAVYGALQVFVYRLIKKR